MKFTNVKGILFDYGGTLDSNGLHWSEVIWLQYLSEKVPVSKAVFREAYVFAERTMGKNPLVHPEDNFLDLLRIKMKLEIGWLIDNGSLEKPAQPDLLPERLAQDCYRYAKRCIEAARPILQQLSERYPMVLVTNFYGNMPSVLKDFRIDHLFRAVVESATVGVRKPDPAIFTLGIEKLACSPAETVVMGDSYSKDILPATTLGCPTVWLKNIGWEPYRGDETADAVITSFEQIKKIFALD